MVVLPRADTAIVDLAKLAAYALIPSHPRGRDKARVFRAALGIGAGDAPWLRDAILALLPTAEAVLEGADRYGARVPGRPADRA